VIWIVLPTRFDIMNMSMPNYLRRQYMSGLHRVASFAYLPPPPLVGWSSLIVIVLLFFEYMRLALECQADALDARGDEANDNADLCA
jgi:hypothetical protein